MGKTSQKTFTKWLQCSLALSMLLIGLPGVSWAIIPTTYLGIQVGGSDLDVSASRLGVSPATHDSDDELAWRAYGGLRFNQNFGLEAGYLQFGDEKLTNALGVSGAKTDVEQRTFDFMGKLTFPLNSAAEIFAKGGFAYVKFKSRPNATAALAGAGGVTTERVRGIYGLGASYSFIPSVAVDVGWLHLSDGNGIPESDFYSLGLMYLFD